MGADIHMYVEYKHKDSDYWHGFGGRINPGRNYGMFAILANVRGHFKESFTPKGLKGLELSYVCKDDLYLDISEDGKGERETTLERAFEWNKRYGCELLFNGEKPYRVQHPDWHSHSWMNVKELSEAFKIYKKYEKKEYGESHLPAEYKALLDLMKSLEKGGYDTRVVFWFDN